MEINYRQSASFSKKLRQCLFAVYCKITDQEKDENLDYMNAYGNAGNVVHKTLEYYYGNLHTMNVDLALVELRHYFNALWNSTKYPVVDQKIDKDVYWTAVLNGVKLNPSFTELEYQYDYILKYTNEDGEEIEVPVIGFADVKDSVNNTIVDWKTATYKASKLREYKEQMRFYAYLEYKLFGKIPICRVYFNKVDRPVDEFTFTLDEIMEIETRIIESDIELRKRYKTLDFPRMPSNGNCHFCPYKKTCASDLLKNDEKEKYEVTFNLKKDTLLVEADIPDIVHRKIEKITNFEVKNKEFRIQAMKQRGIVYDGIKRLWRRKPIGGQTKIGYIHSIHSILKEYAHSNGKLLRLKIKDYRNQEVMTNTWKEFPKKLNAEFAFGEGKYAFQEEAVQALINKRWGICEVGTGGGKTAIAAECIRRLHTRTLFVIDNKDLLLQTKEEYEELLGVPCGIVGMKQRGWYKPIVLATIQTLEKHLKEFAGHLSLFNLVIFDETHIIASKSFQELSKYLTNSKYRFGFSATAKRDDLEDQVIYAGTGEVVYRKNAKELTELGVLTPVEAIFYHYPLKSGMSENWQNEYTDQIVLNDNRNDLIRKITQKYVDEGKQIMILIKDIKNGHAHHLTETIPNARLIYGKTKDDLRVQDLEDFKNGKFQVLVGNIKIFNKGINIKNLDVVINAAANAGEVVTIQTIGRSLRKHRNKKIAYYIDFFDEGGEYVLDHTMSRIEALKKEYYDVRISQSEDS